MTKYKPKKPRGFLMSLSGQGFWRKSFVVVVQVSVIGFLLTLGVMSHKNTNKPIENTQYDFSIDTLLNKTVNLSEITNEDWIMGDKTAEVSMVVFSNINCIHCAGFHLTTKKLVQNNKDKVNLIYRHFPVISLYPDSPKKAEAVECAGELGGNDIFWRYLNVLFTSAPMLQISELPQIAEDIGLNRKKFEQCLDSNRHTKKIRKHSVDAKGAGAIGTPFLVIVFDDIKIPISGAVSYGKIENIINKLLTVKK